MHRGSWTCTVNRGLAPAEDPMVYGTRVSARVPIGLCSPEACTEKLSVHPRRSGASDRRGTVGLDDRDTPGAVRETVEALNSAPAGLAAIPVATVQVGLGAVIMLMLAPFTATASVNLSWRAGLSVADLGVIGTGLAYMWNSNVVGEWGAANASTVTYLTPVVGGALGIAVLGENLTWNEPLGAVIVIAGIAVSQGRLRVPGRSEQSRIEPEPADVDAAARDKFIKRCIRCRLGLTSAPCAP